MKDVFPLRSYDDLKGMLDEHYFCGSDSSNEVASTPASQTESPPWKETTSSPSNQELVTATTNDTTETDIDDLLKDL